MKMEVQRYKSHKAFLESLPLISQEIMQPQYAENTNDTWKLANNFVVNSQQAPFQGMLGSQLYQCTDEAFNGWGEDIVT